MRFQKKYRPQAVLLFFNPVVKMLRYEPTLRPYLMNFAI